MAGIDFAPFGAIFSGHGLGNIGALLYLNAKTKSFSIVL